MFSQISVRCRTTTSLGCEAACPGGVPTHFDAPAAIAKEFARHCLVGQPVPNPAALAGLHRVPPHAATAAIRAPIAQGLDGECQSGHRCRPASMASSSAVSMAPSVRIEHRSNPRRDRPWGDPREAVVICGPCRNLQFAGDHRAGQRSAHDEAGGGAGGRNDGGPSTGAVVCDHELPLVRLAVVHARPCRQSDVFGRLVERVAPPTEGQAPQA